MDYYLASLSPISTTIDLMPTPPAMPLPGPLDGIFSRRPPDPMQGTDLCVDMPMYTSPRRSPSSAEPSILKKILVEGTGKQFREVHMGGPVPSRHSVREAMGVTTSGEILQPVFPANQQQREMAIPANYNQPASYNNNCYGVPQPVNPLNVATYRQGGANQVYHWMKTKYSAEGETGAAPKRTRQIYNKQQKLVLEAEYSMCTVIKAARREEVARIVGLSQTQVKIWFQNRRMKDKKLKGIKSKQSTRKHNVSPVNGLYGPNAPVTTSAGIPIHPNAAVPVTTSGIAHPSVAPSAHQSVAPSAHPSVASSLEAPYCGYYPEQQGYLHQQQCLQQEQLNQQQLQLQRWPEQDLLQQQQQHQYQVQLQLQPLPVQNNLHQQQHLLQQQHLHQQQQNCLHQPQQEYLHHQQHQPFFYH